MEPEVGLLLRGEIVGQVRAGYVAAVCWMCLFELAVTLPNEQRTTDSPSPKSWLVALYAAGVAVVRGQAIGAQSVAGRRALSTSLYLLLNWRLATTRIA